MVNNPTTKKVRPRGKARRYNSEQLNALTSIKSLRQMADEAAQDWRENGPRSYKQILGRGNDE